jgi:hypothetical protein
MPSVFTLEAPFGDPVVSQDYLELLGNPTLGYDSSIGHNTGIASAMFSDATSFFSDQGLVFGTVMVFAASVTVGGVLGHAFIATLKKFGWNG